MTAYTKASSSNTAIASQRKTHRPKKKGWLGLPSISQMGQNKAVDIVDGLITDGRMDEWLKEVGDQFIDGGGAEKLLNKVARVPDPTTTQAARDLSQLKESMNALDEPPQEIISKIDAAVASLQNLSNNQNRALEPSHNSSQKQLEVIPALTNALSAYKTSLSNSKSSPSLNQQGKELLEQLEPVLDTLNGMNSEQTGPIAKALVPLITHAVQTAQEVLGKTFSQMGLSNPFEPASDLPPNAATMTVPGMIRALVCRDVDAITVGGKTLLLRALYFLHEKVKNDANLLDTNSFDMQETIDDIAKCIESVERSESSIAEAVRSIGKFMERHPISVQSILFSLPVGREVDALDSSTTLYRQTQLLRSNEPHSENLPANNDYKGAIDRLWNSISGTISLIGAYEVITYLTGQPPIGVDDNPSSFPSIMRNLQASGSADREKSFIKEIREALNRNKKIYRLTRWILSWTLPFIVWASKSLIHRAFHKIREYVTKTVQEINGDKKTINPNKISARDLPIEIATRVIGSIPKGFALADDNPSFNKQEALTAYQKTPQFLRGHDNLGSLYKQVGDAVIDKMSISLTTRLDSINSYLYEHAYLPTLLVRCFIELMKYLFVMPIEWILNKALKGLLKSIVARTESIKNVVTKVTTTDNDSSIWMDQAHLSALKHLNQQLTDAPMDLNALNQVDNNCSDTEKEATKEAFQEFLKAVITLSEACKGNSMLNTMLDPQYHPKWAQTLTIFFFRELLKPNALDAAAEILTQNYYQLFTNARIDKYLYLILGAINNNLLSNEPPLDPIEKEAQKRSYQIVIDSQQKNLYHNFIQVITPKLLGENTDTAVLTRENISTLKSALLGSDSSSQHRRSLLEDDNNESQISLSPAASEDIDSASHKGLIATVRSKLDIICAPGRLPKEIQNALEQSNDAIEQIILLEQKTLSTMPAGQYKGPMRAIIQKFCDFHLCHHKIYNLHLTRALPRETSKHIGEIATISTTVSEALQSSIDQAITPYHTDIKGFQTAVYEPTERLFFAS